MQIWEMLMPEAPVSSRKTFVKLEIVGSFEVMLIVGLKGFHHSLRARSRVVITNSATVGSFDARGPATFSTRILFCCI